MYILSLVPRPSYKKFHGGLGTRLVHTMHTLRVIVTRSTHTAGDMHVHNMVNAAYTVLLISLHLEQREYLRDGVDRASIYLSPRKPTGY